MYCLHACMYCMYVWMDGCMHVCMHICLSFHTHVSKPFKQKATCIQEIKSKQSLYYFYTQVSISENLVWKLFTEAGFPGQLFRHSTTIKHPAISPFKKWTLPVFTLTKFNMKSSLEDLLEEFLKNNIIERLWNSSRKYFCAHCVIFWAVVYICTLSNTWL